MRVARQAFSYDTATGEKPGRCRMSSTSMWSFRRAAGRKFVRNTSAVSTAKPMRGCALIFFSMFSQRNSSIGIGPISPMLLRVGVRNTGIAPVIVIACSTDL